MESITTRAASSKTAAKALVLVIVNHNQDCVRIRTVHFLKPPIPGWFLWPPSQVLAFFFSLYKYARGSAAANRKLKHPDLGAELRARDSLLPPGLLLLLLTVSSQSDTWKCTPQEAPSQTVPVLGSWWSNKEVCAGACIEGRTAPWPLGIINPVGCLKDTGLSHPSHLSLRTLKMKVLSQIAHCHPSV